MALSAGEFGGSLRLSLLRLFGPAQSSYGSGSCRGPSQLLETLRKNGKPAKYVRQVSRNLIGQGHNGQGAL